jgi:hypothetical protein
MSIEDRLARLERENRSLKVAGLLVLLVAASVFLMGQAQPTTVEAENFVVKDNRGRIVAQLSASYSEDYRQSWAGLSLFDADQQTRTYFSNANNRGSFRIAAADGGVIYMTAEPDGDARIRVFGPSGLDGPVANIRMLPGGETVSIFLADGNDLRAVLQHTRGKPVWFWTAP